MKTKIISFVLMLSLILTGCAQESDDTSHISSEIRDKQSVVIFDVFDTIISLVSYQDEADFDAMHDYVESEYIRYNQLYDIYNNYDGINNIKTINDNAGIASVKVDAEIIELLEFSKEWYYKTDGKFDISMGTLLDVWSDVREEATVYGNAVIPTYEELEPLASAANIEAIVVDKENSTVFITTSEVQINVGAVAKGFATEKIATSLESTYDNFAISAGGNVRIYGQPFDGERSRWGAGIQNPLVDDNFISVGGNIDLAFLNGRMSLVCSGGYQRYFVKDGVRYHHLIDLETLYPGNNYAGVAVFYEDSGVSDVLSTAIFFMEPVDAIKFIETIDGAAAQLIALDGTIYNSSDTALYLSSAGITSTTP